MTHQSDDFSTKLSMKMKHSEKHKKNETQIVLDLRPDTNSRPSTDDVAGSLPTGNEMETPDLYRNSSLGM